jgi:hypothetical protein
MSRLLKVALIGSVAVFIALAGLIYIRMKLAAPSEEVQISTSSRGTGFQIPPGEPVPIKFTNPSMTSTEVRAFLTADFEIVRRMADVPAGIRNLYTMNDRPLVAIADPGKVWQPTDVITDPYIPRRRLIFAGVAQDRAFIYYEQGGIGYSRDLELFRMKAPDAAVGLWRGYCNSAKPAGDPSQLAQDCTCCNSG